MPKVSVRTWDKPADGTKAVALTGARLIGRKKYVIDGTSGSWTRIRGSADQVAELLRKEFARCGFKPKNLKVIEVRNEGAEPNERGAFYLNIGYLRGLDPDEVYRMLREVVGRRTLILSGRRAEMDVLRFPNNCGHRKVFEALARLEQRVERPPAMMVGQENGEAVSA